MTTTTLDKVIGDFGGAVGVLKIDIEGHELQAFSGAQESLESGKIRDIIYEDYGDMDSAVSRLLRSFGYSIFGLDKTLFGLVLRERSKAVQPFEPPNLLATLNPARARQRMARRGYNCLNKRPGLRATVG